MPNDLAEPVGISAVQGIAKLSLLKQLGIMLGIAGAVALGVAIALWGQGGDMRPLFGKLDVAATGQVAQQLEQLGLDYEIDSRSGLILVNASDVYSTRMQLAQTGLPDAPAEGYELLDQEQPIGMSSRMESVRYVRSLEGELARTIASIKTISQARVHLAIPRQTSFIGALKQPSASVLVTTNGGALSNEHIQAIQNLVGNSVPSLSSDSVSVTDQFGSAQTKGEERNLDRQLQYEAQVQTNLEQGIASVLMPLVGASDFSVQVRADIDFTRIETAEEIFTPDKQVVRSAQTHTQKKTGGIEPEGIPGALTNQPPGNVEVDNNPAVEPAENEDGEEDIMHHQEQALTNFEVDRKLQHTVPMTGTIKRITAAVVINDTGGGGAADDQDGATTARFNDEQLAQIEALIQAAIGFDEERGDSLSLMLQPFTMPPEIEVADTPIYEQPWFIEAAKVGASALLILVVILTIFRPMLSRLTEVAETETVPANLSHLGDEALAQLDSPDVSSVESQLLLGDSSYENELRAIKGLIAEDSGRVAQVVKRWVTTGG